MKLAVQIRFIGSFYPYDDQGRNLLQLLELKKKTEAQTFAVCTDFEMSRSMYHHFTGRGHLEGKVSLGNVGNKSLTKVVELFIPGNSKPIMRNRLRMGLMDANQGKLLVLPDWFKEPLVGKGILEGEDFRVARLQRPQKTFHQHSVVSYNNY